MDDSGLTFTGNGNRTDTFFQAGKVCNAYFSVCSLHENRFKVIHCLAVFRPVRNYDVIILSVIAENAGSSSVDGVVDFLGNGGNVNSKRICTLAVNYDFYLRKSPAHTYAGLSGIAKVIYNITDFFCNVHGLIQVIRADCNINITSHHLTAEALTKGEGCPGKFCKVGTQLLLNTCGIINLFACFRQRDFDGTGICGRVSSAGTNCRCNIFVTLHLIFDDIFKT